MLARTSETTQETGDEARPIRGTGGVVGGGAGVVSGGESGVGSVIGAGV